MPVLINGCWYKLTGHKMRIATIGLALAASGIYALPTTAAIPTYDINLQLLPAIGRLAVRVQMTGLACQGAVARLYLNRALVIDSVRVDDRAVRPALDPPDAARFYLDAARAIDIPCPRKAADLSYSGPGALHPDGRNQVSPDLVELSLYGGWYPLATIDQKTNWRLRVALPPGWTHATSGLVSSQRASGVIALDVRSTRPSDIVLIASPRFRERFQSDCATQVRVLLSDDADAAAQARADTLGREAAAAITSLTELLGPAQTPGPVTPQLIFTRRGGPLSYSRLPLIVTPQAALTDNGDRPLALNIRHEVAHFWSRAKGAEDDWINEGVAEYLAARLTREADGQVAYEELITRYGREVASAGPGVAIVQTPGDESRGYINRYQRPTLLLDALERQSDPVTFSRFLRMVALLGEATTTGTFELAVQQVLGRRTAAGFGRCLRAGEWPSECGGAAPVTGKRP